MRGQFNKGTIGNTTAREPDAVTMKNLIITVVAIIIAILLIQVHNENLKDQQPIEIGNSTDHAAAIELPAPLKTIKEQKLPVWDELSAAEKVKRNPNKCDLSKQVMWADGSCHDTPASKPAPKPEPKKSTPAKPNTASIASCEALRPYFVKHGITGAELTAALELARVESGCNQNAENEYSGACNVLQELPCGKWGGTASLDKHIVGAIGRIRSTYRGSWVHALNVWKSRSPHWW